MRLLLIGIAASLFTLCAEEARKPAAFAGKVDEVFFLRLDAGDLVLESIQAFLAEQKISDGALLTAVGSVAGCSVHGVNSKKTTSDRDMAVDSMSGTFAGGGTHIHTVLTAPDGTMSGHLENGCRVKNHLEIVLVSFRGMNLQRVKGVVQRVPSSR
jgi:uncharacterized protein